MKGLGRRLKAVEGRVRTSEVPEIELWRECDYSKDVFRNDKLGLELTREELDRRTAERRERYGPKHVLAIRVTYVDTPTPEWEKAP